MLLNFGVQMRSELRRLVAYKTSRIGRKENFFTGPRALNLMPDLKMSCPGSATSTPAGLVLGMYCDLEDKYGDKMRFTDSACRYNDYVKGKLKCVLKSVLPLPKLGQVRTLYDLDGSFQAVSVVGLGTDCVGYDPVEEMDEQKEVVRVAAGTGVRALQDLEMQRVFVDSLGHSESAAEGACMGVWVYQSNRAECKRIPVPKVELFDSSDWIGWKIGQEKAAAQNLARQLMETPANQLTPTVFALSVQEVLAKASVDVVVRTSKWARHRKLNTFLAVSSGSCQQPIFLEVSYEGCDPDLPPIILVGKGVTFDAGGLCLRSCEEMRHAGGEMAGAAAVVAAVRAIASLQIPINVRGLIPLCENLPGACAFKPGDVITSYNGRTILVSDTTCDGQLILADALSYSATYDPKFVVDIGSLSRDIAEVTGDAAAVVFSNSDQLYSLLRIASIHTGDRLVRLPLWCYYAKGVQDSAKADCRTVGRDAMGSSCTAAAFLWGFVPPSSAWLHIDTAGVGRVSGRGPNYLRRGMSGRPTRTLVEFLSQLACAREADKSCDQAEE